MHRTCIAIYPRHLPRHGPADLLHDLIHVKLLNGTRDLKCFTTALSPCDPFTRHVDVIGEFTRKNQIIRWIRSKDICEIEISISFPILRFLRSTLNLARRPHRQTAVSVNFANYEFLSLCTLAHSANSDFNQLRNSELKINLILIFWC